MPTFLALAGSALILVATLYALAALLCRGRLAHVRPCALPVPPPVSVLKPLCGAEPNLEANLASFCTQDYPAWQIVFGVRDPCDPAIAVVERLTRRFPGRDIVLVVDPRIHGANLKVSNLINMMPAVRHPWLVLADSDIAVAPDYLARVTAPLHDPGVGIVTCLYHGNARGFWPTMGSLFIDTWFAPSVRVASTAGSTAFAFGATIALRADTLRAAGGFAALRDCLADDFRLGERTRRLGLRTVLSDVEVATDVTETRLAALWSRERRWLQTIRSLNPAGYAFAFVTITLPLLALGLALAPTPVNGAIAFVGAAARLGLHRRRPGQAWLAPLRDLLLLAAWVSAFAGRTTRWRQHLLHIGTVDGSAIVHGNDAVNDQLHIGRVDGSAVHAVIRDASDIVHGNGAVNHRRATSISPPTKPKPEDTIMNTPTFKKTLFLQAPSFDGFDGGAGSRYQARREIRSFWYPTWLAQPAALVPGSRLVDAPADGLTVAQALDIARGFDLVILHTSTPSFAGDARFAELLKEGRPDALIGMVGARVAVDPGGSLGAGRAIDFVAREEFDYTCRDIAAGLALEDIAGVSWRDAAGVIHHNPARPIIEDMDALPFVAPVYRRDLDIRNYCIGYLLYPYVSLYTGRGCRSRCTFCLWPQTVGGHRYRTRSAANVLDEVRWIREHMPEVKEIMFDDDTFTDVRTRAEAIARGLGELGVTWSCNAKANVPYSTLKIMKDNGLRLLLVGYESGDDQILLNIKKGLRTDIARRFAADCRALGIKVHGTFILGLPGETRETIAKSIEFAKEINPHTIQVSLAAPYPGTRLYEQALENDWIAPNKTIPLVNDSGVQLAALAYPHLPREEIYHGVEQFYRSFYFRPAKIWEIVSEMARSWETTRRRLREGVEFFHFLRAHGASHS